MTDRYTWGAGELIPGDDIDDDEVSEAAESLSQGAPTQALSEQVSLVESIAGAPLKSRRFRARLIAGDIQGSCGYYPAGMLRQHAGVFREGLPVYLDHPGVTEAYERPERSVRDLAGRLAGPATYDRDGLYADVEVYPHWAPVIEAMADDIGMSIRATGTVEASTVESIRGPIVTSLAEATSVDFVTAAGAGGKIVALLESARSEGELLRLAVEAKAPPFVKKDTKVKDEDEKPDDAEDTETDDEEDELPFFLRGKESAVSEARTIAGWLESRLHLTFTTLADDMYGEGHLTRTERIALSGAIGDALGAFATRVEADAPHLLERDPWEDPGSPDQGATDQLAKPTTDTAPPKAAVTENAPGSPPADTTEIKEGRMPELTDEQARELQEARAAAEHDRDAALSKATNAEMRLARFEALEAARSIATSLLEESTLPAAARSRVLASTVTAEIVPLTAEHKLDEAALKARVEEATKTESTYLASLAEATGAGQVRGLGESTATTFTAAPDPVTTTALEETYQRRGLTPEAARIASTGRL